MELGGGHSAASEASDLVDQGDASHRRVWTPAYAGVTPDLGRRVPHYRVIPANAGIVS